jgi:hypothetical protein
MTIPTDTTDTYSTAATQSDGWICGRINGRSTDRLTSVPSGQSVGRRDGKERLDVTGVEMDQKTLTTAGH